MKVFKQRAWLYVVVGVVLVFFFVVAPRLGEQATEIDMGKQPRPDAEQVLCEVCGEKAVTVSHETATVRGWCALHVPPEYAVCAVCGAEGAPLWKRQDGRMLPFCEEHVPQGEDWERVTLPRQEPHTAPPNAADEQAGGG
jgi:hypothetical protein